MTTNLHSDPREQAEAVARWCGWETEARTKPSFADPSKMIAAPPVWVHRELGIRLSLPPYAASLDAMREVEDEIERRGLVEEYKDHLFSLWLPNAESVGFEHFLIRASAEVRLQAAARVIEEVERAG